MFTPASWLKAHGEAERALEEVVREFFEDQAARMARAVQGYDVPTPSIVPAIFRIDEEHKAFMAAVMPQLARTMAAGAAAMARPEPERGYDGLLPADVTDWLTDFELPEELVGEFYQTLNELAEQPYWEAVQEGVERDLTRIIGAGLEDGESAYKIGMRIRQEMGGMAANVRAQRIARTETTGALNAGHQLEAEQLEAAGLPTLKTWSTVGDKDVRADHVDMEGVQVRSHENFTLAGYEVPFPGHWLLPAEQRIRCRCTIMTDVIGDMP